MSVITNKENDWSNVRGSGKKCCVCGDKIHHFPFLHWHGSPIILCAGCCESIKRGLMADLIHVIAIKDLNELGYNDETLVRMRTTKAEQNEKRENSGG
jgi:hypothetical protein